LLVSSYFRFYGVTRDNKPASRMPAVTAVGLLTFLHSLTS